MPSFRFRGFATASPVSLSVSQGTATATASVASWAQGTTASLAIDVFADDGRDAANAFIAPVGVHFEARPSGFAVDERVLPSPSFTETPPTSTVQIYDEAFHEITYVWRLTAYPAGYATTAQNGPLNIPDAWNDRTLAYGKHVAFCFDVPGSYTVECWAVDELGATATGTVTFASGGDKPAIGSADALFTGNQTICINPAGDTDFSWAPAGASLYRAGLNGDTTDTEAVQGAFAQMHSVDSLTQNRRILFKNGAEFDLRDSGDLASDPSWWRAARIHVGSPLSGAPATLNYGNRLWEISFRTNFASVHVYNLNLRGRWNEESETGNPYGQVSSAPLTLQAPTSYTVHKVTVNGAGVAFNGPDTIQVHYDNGRGCIGPITFSDCRASHWRTYGFYSNAPEGGTAGTAFPDPLRVGFIDFQIAKSPDAVTEPDATVPISILNESAPMRFGHFDRVYMGRCSFFSNDPLRQPAFRPYNDPYEDFAGGTRRKWAYFNVDRIALEGGSQFGLTPNGMKASRNHENTAGSMPINAVFDKVLCLASPFTSNAGGSTATPATGLTYRNIVIVSPATSAFNPFTIFFNMEVITQVAWDVNALARAQPIRVHNVSVISPRTSAQNGGASSWSWFQPEFLANFAVTLENVVLHTPNMNTARDDGPFVSSPLAGFVPKGGRRRWNFARFAKTIPEIPVGGTFDVLYSEIPAQDMGGNAHPALTQAYWTVDHPDHNYHYIVNGNTVRRAASGQMSVQYLSDRIRFTNTHTGAFAAGTWRVYIDRRAYLTTDTSRQTAADLHLSWRPAPGSPAIPSVDLGLHAVDDLLGQNRTVPRTRGAFEAVG